MAKDKVSLAQAVRDVGGENPSMSVSDIRDAVIKKYPELAASAKKSLHTTVYMMRRPKKGGKKAAKMGRTPVPAASGSIVQEFKALVEKYGKEEVTAIAELMKM